MQDHLAMYCTAAFAHVLCIQSVVAVQLRQFLVVVVVTTQIPIDSRCIAAQAIRYLSNWHFGFTLLGNPAAFFQTKVRVGASH